MMLVAKAKVPTMMTGVPPEEHLDCARCCVHDQEGRLPSGDHVVPMSAAYAEDHRRVRERPERDTAVRRDAGSDEEAAVRQRGSKAVLPQPAESRAKTEEVIERER